MGLDRQILSMNNFKIMHPTIRKLVMRAHEPKEFNDLRSIISPAKYQYQTTGLSRAINSSRGRFVVAEYQHNFFV